MKELEAKVLKKIKNDIGDLLTDEDIKQLVEKAVDQAFFKPIATQDNYNRTTTKPPLINQLITESLTPHFKSAIDVWIINNEETVKETMQKLVNDGAGMAIIQSFNNRFDFALSTLQHNIEQQLYQNQ